MVLEFSKLPSLEYGFSEVCLGELGCIRLKDCPKRPLNPVPARRETINTKFLFYNRGSPDDVPKIAAYKIRPYVLRTTTFDPAKLTKVFHSSLQGEVSSLNFHSIQSIKNLRFVTSMRPFSSLFMAFTTMCPGRNGSSRSRTLFYVEAISTSSSWTGAEVTACRIPRQLSTPESSLLKSGFS